MSDDDEDYKVGYKKPPKHTQFKSGQSGNPKGRPKNKAKSLQELYSMVFNEKVQIRIGNKTKKVSKIEAIFYRLAELAMKGDLRAMKEAMKMKQQLSAPEGEKSLEEWLDVLDEREKEAGL